MLISLFAVNSLFLTWWALLGGGMGMQKRIGLLETRLDTVIKREGLTSELGDEVLVNKAAAEAVKNIKPELQMITSKANQSSLPNVLGIYDSVKEYFVPLGTGSTTKQEWADVPALQATVNGDRYGASASAYFEASMRSVNGKAEARLLDKTTSEVIHQSNIAHEGTDYSWVVSKPFGLSPGGRTFMVQMRSSSGEMVEASGVRLRIVAGE